MATLEPYSVSALVRKIHVAVFTFIILLSCSGCRAAYVFYAASGQFRLLRNSIEIEDALKLDSLEDEIKSRLKLVSEIKEFGEEKLGLRKTGSYRKVYLNSVNSPIYVLSACPKDSLEIKTWWFPIVGKMPYLGFFDLEQAEKKSDKLKDDNMDTDIRTGGAYSTLGWFDDPVTLSLLKGSAVNIAETLLHEMTHATLYIKGDGEFNEGLANLVGKTGAELFFRNKYGPEHPFTVEARNSLHDELLFSDYINAFTGDLAKLYSSGLTFQHKMEKREELFRAHREKYIQTKDRYKTGHYRYFETNEFNNAYLLSIALYRRKFPGFYRMLDDHEGSVPDMLAYLRKAKESN